jgi:hypothetical protein
MDLHDTARAFIAGAFEGPLRTAVLVALEAGPRRSDQAEGPAYRASKALDDAAGRNGRRLRGSNRLRS